MTFTETNLSPSTSILLSPSKRRRISPPLEQQSNCTLQDLWKWTLTQEAVAPCRVRDVFAMKANDDHDFFWLGRVPCRSVRFVGLLVGVQVYEKRMVYSVDDGTAVIDCVYRPEAPVSPTKLDPKGRPKAQPRLHPSSTSSTLTTLINPTPTLKPIAFVGTSIKVVGKVNRWHNTRQIRADSIQRCQSQNEEFLHWRQVLHLHKSHYFLPGPFVIPAPTPAPTPSSKLQPEVGLSVESDCVFKTPSSPMAVSSVPSSAATSPTKSEKYSILGLKSPPKLRHPSRLSSRELTGNTFRIYLKHYMNNAPVISNTIDEEIDNALSNLLSTPTKHKRRRPTEDDRTPRPTRHGGPSMIEQTPRPQSRIPPNEDTRGFTLSYLRRVPELADMALRVVKAEAKRKRREEREREKQSEASSSIFRMTSHPTKPTKPTEEKAAAKAKRLFQWAIIELYVEGSIILWEGDIRPLPPHFSSSQSRDPETNVLWKHSNSTTGESSIFSSTINMTTVSRVDEEDEGELSDPREDEESYVPTTPAILASSILTCIRTLTSPPPPPANLTKIQSLTIAPPPGPTAAQITTRLRKTDERYERVGEWLVKDALEWLASEEGGERVWCVGAGRWEVCM